MRSNLLLSFISTLLVLICALYGYGLFTIYQYPVINISIEGTKIIQFDPKMGFRAVENSSSTRRHLSLGLSYDIFTDSTGARISNTDNTKSPRPAPITAIGCSFTWGHGLSNDQTYSKLLEKRLGVEVNNYAMGSYGSVQSLQTLEKLGGDSSLIIYGFINDHVSRNVTPCAPAYAPLCLYVPTVKKKANGIFFIDDNIPVNNIDSSDDFYSLSRKNDWSPIRVSLFGYKFILNKLAKGIGKHEISLPTETHLDATAYVIGEMERYAKDHEARLLIVNLDIGKPNFHFLSLSNNYTWNNNTFFLDASRFDGFSAQQLLIPGDLHPNAKANELIANRIYEFVINNKLANFNPKSAAP